MVSGHPDFTEGVSLIAYKIASLPIDIVAQTIGNISVNIVASDITLNINISSQSANLEIDIKAQTVDLTIDMVKQAYIKNVPRFINSGFETGDFTGYIEIDYSTISTAYVFTGVYGVVMYYTAGHISRFTQILDVPVECKYVGELSVVARMRKDYGAGTLYIVAYYTDGTTVGHTFNLADDDAWHGCNMTPYLDTAKTLRGMYLRNTSGANMALGVDDWVLLVYNPISDILTTIDINIAASAVTMQVNLYSSSITLDINIKTSDITLNINIAAQDANLEIDIKAQTVDLNIKTSGGTNIIIDRLTQTAYTERRVTISNNGETPAYDFMTGTDREGKFFPRGCRGFIKTIDIYCQDMGVAGGTFTIYLSPYPSAGYLYSATVTVPAEGGVAWRSATFNKMWNYDSLFISWVGSIENMGFAFDSGTPLDSYISSDSGVIWVLGTSRCWVRAIMGGQTIGDIPISGFVNVKDIDSLGSAVRGDFYNQTQDVPPHSIGTITDWSLPNRDVIIESLEFGAKFPTCCHLRVEVWNVEAQDWYNSPVMLAKADGTLTHSDGITPNDIHDHLSDIFEELVYSAAPTNEYKFGLKHPLRFSSGVRIRVKNSHATETFKISVAGVANVLSEARMRG